jgi:hypothetical protein
MDPTIESRIESPDAEILVLRPEFEVRAIEHNSPTK